MQHVVPNKTNVARCCVEMLRAFGQALTSEFHGKFYAKNRYRMDHKAMSTILVFRVKFTLEFTSLEMNFS